MSPRLQAVQAQASGLGSQVLPKAQGLPEPLPRPKGGCSLGHHGPGTLLPAPSPPESRQRQPRGHRPDKPQCSEHPRLGLPKSHV